MPRNPYLNRSMIASVDEFHGRRREVNYVMSRIGATTPQSVSVLGERRVGKSSLLWHIAQPEVHEQHLETDRCLFLLVDFQGRQNRPMEDFFRFLGEQLDARGVLEAAVSPLRVAADLEKVVQRLAESGRRLVFLFDEFECITRNHEFGPEFFGFLRSLANLYPVAFVTSSQRDLPTLCHGQEIAESPFFNIFSKIHLGLMPAEEVRELIVAPSAAAGLDLQSHLEKLVVLGGHWPFFVQIACTTAIDIMMESGADGLDIHLLDRRFQEETASHFQYYWDHFDEAERAILVALVRGIELDSPNAVALEALRLNGYVQADEGRARPFSAAFSSFISEMLAREAQAPQAGSAPQPDPPRDGETARRAGPRKWVLAGLALAIMTLAVTMGLRLFVADPASRVQQSASSNLPPEGNYPPASGYYRLSDLQVDDLFASFYPTHARRPLGRIRITNDDTIAVEATVHFYLSDWQRRPGEQTLQLAPQSTQQLELTVLLDPAIVHQQDVLPIEAKVVVTIHSEEQVQTLQETGEIMVYGRGALRWDSVARAAAFITSTAGEVTSFARPLLGAFAAETRSLGRPGSNLVQAMVLFEALKQHGVSYIPDSNTPYAQRSQDASTVDHIQYPAEVLQNKAGECDDLTVLYCALLETAGVATALVDYPDHIFLLFDSGIARQEAYALPVEEKLYIPRGEKLWIPLEITLLDRSFNEAWRTGAEELAKLSLQDCRRRIIDTDQAWEEFPPASTPPGSLVAAPDRASLDTALATALGELQRLIDQHIDTNYLNPLVARPDDTRLRLELIKLYLALTRYDTAISSAETDLLQKRGDRTATLNQLGIAYTLKGETTRAALNFEQAVALRPTDAGLRRNLDLALERAGRGRADEGQQLATLEGAGSGKSEAKLLDVEDFYWLE